MIALLLMLACGGSYAPVPVDVSTLYATCLLREATACRCVGGHRCDTDPAKLCAHLDPAACEAGDEDVCEEIERYEPIYDEWSCIILYYHETCSTEGSDCF